MGHRRENSKNSSISNEQWVLLLKMEERLG
jgi:hypothetical protein